MTRVIANKPTSTTRGKRKVNGSWKPKGKGNKSNGPTWQAHRHGKKRSNRMRQYKASAKTMSKPTKGIKGGSTSPRAHVLHTIRDSMNPGHATK